MKLLDVVQLERDMPEIGLFKGAIGAVTELLPPDGLEAEFPLADGLGRTVLATLRLSDVRLAPTL